jgi:hypothetical protein
MSTDFFRAKPQLEHTLWTESIGELNYLLDRATGAAVDWANAEIDGNVMQQAFHWNRYMALTEVFYQCRYEGIGR